MDFETDGHGVCVAAERLGAKDLRCGVPSIRILAVSKVF